MIAGIKNIKLGNSQADKVCLGDKLLWVDGTLSVETLPSRVYYVLGEQLDLSGIVVRRQGTQTSEIVPVSDLVPSGFDSSTVGIKTVTLSYVNKSVLYEVGVTNLVDANNKIMIDGNGKLLII